MWDAIIYRVKWFGTWIGWGKSLGRYTPTSYVQRPDSVLGLCNVVIGDGSVIMAHAKLDCIAYEGRHGAIEIGDKCTINMYFHCGAACSVTIGSGTAIAGRVYITDHDHAMPLHLNQLIVKPVVIGPNCWLGEGCAILKGVTLGEGCVVGANAVVTRSAPPFSILAGVPARVIKTYIATDTGNRPNASHSG